MANGHPSPKTNPDYWRSRIEELDKRVCRDGAELQRTISELVEMGRQFRTPCYAAI